MGSAVQLSFYSVTTTTDGNPTETPLHEDIGGTLDIDRQVLSENPNQSAFVQLLTFYPDTILSGIVTGMKATDGTTDYTVQFEETFPDHQEISLKKVNP